MEEPWHGSMSPLSLPSISFLVSFKLCFGGHYTSGCHFLSFLSSLILCPRAFPLCDAGQEEGKVYTPVFRPCSAQMLLWAPKSHVNSQPELPAKREGSRQGRSALYRSAEMVQSKGCAEMVQSKGSLEVHQRQLRG